MLGKPLLEESGRISGSCEETGQGIEGVPVRVYPYQGLRFVVKHTLQSLSAVLCDLQHLAIDHYSSAQFWIAPSVGDCSELWDIIQICFD